MDSITKVRLDIINENMSEALEFMNDNMLHAEEILSSRVTGDVDTRYAEAYGVIRATLMLCMSECKLTKRIEIGG